jgi:hypothetical protein
LNRDHIVRRHRVAVGTHVTRVAVCVARPSAFTQEKRLERALSSPPVWGAVSRNK